MKVIFGYILPGVMLASLCAITFFGSFSSSASKEDTSFILVILIVLLAMITIALRDWSTGRLAHRMMEAMNLQLGYMWVGLVLMTGGIGGVAAYTLLFTFVSVTLLPFLHGFELHVGIWLGLIALISYARGAYLFFENYRKSTQ